MEPPKFQTTSFIFNEVFWNRGISGWIILNIITLILLRFGCQYPFNNLHEKHLTLTWPLNSFFTEISYNKLLRALHEFIEMYFDKGAHKHITTKKGGSKWTSPQNDSFDVFDKNLFQKAVKHLRNNYCDRFHHVMLILMLKEPITVLIVLIFIIKEA